MVGNWKHNIIYNLELEVKTGLHIGGTESELKIGGTDSPVITTYYPDGHEYPYIPGSSLKGKMRSLLLSIGNINNTAINEDTIFKVFGSSNTNSNEQMDRRTRLIVRDAYISEKDLARESLTEVKGENKIDSYTSQATPRFIERVVPGIKFQFQIILVIFEGDDEKAFNELIKTGIDLLNDSYIGGNGTRGYGNVKITYSEPVIKDLQSYENSD